MLIISHYDRYLYIFLGNGKYMPSDQFFVYKDHCFVNMQRFHLDIYHFIICYLAGIQVYLYLYIITSTVDIFKIIKKMYCIDVSIVNMFPSI